MDWFAGALYATGCNRIVFYESHDEAGNSAGTERTIRVAVNNAPLVGATRT
jgi:1,4-alpha-glucan branching enzyme